MKLESLLNFYRRRAIYVVHHVHFQISLVRAHFQQNRRPSVLLCTVDHNRLLQSKYFMKQYVLDAVLLQGKESLLLNIICHQAFNLLASFWGGARHLSSTTDCTPQASLHHPLPRGGVLALKFHRKSRSDLVDTNSAQLCCTISRRWIRQLHRHSSY